MLVIGVAVQSFNSPTVYKMLFNIISKLKQLFFRFLDWLVGRSERVRFIGSFDSVSDDGFVTCDVPIDTKQDCVSSSDDEWNSPEPTYSGPSEYLSSQKSAVHSFVIPKNEDHVNALSTTRIKGRPEYLHPVSQGPVFPPFIPVSIFTTRRAPRVFRDGKATISGFKSSAIQSEEPSTSLPSGDYHGFSKRGRLQKGIYECEKCNCVRWVSRSSCGRCGAASTKTHVPFIPSALHKHSDTLKQRSAAEIELDDLRRDAKKSLKNYRAYSLLCKTLGRPVMVSFSDVDMRFDTSL